MKATLIGFSALLLAAVAGKTAYAQLPCPSCSSQKLQYMPNPAAYAPNSYGMPYAAGYGMPYGGGYGGMPPQPFGGVRPPSNPFGCGSGSNPFGCGAGGCDGGKIMGFPVHPYARSPRDFFMLDLDCCGTH